MRRLRLPEVRAVPASTAQSAVLGVELHSCKNLPHDAMKGTMA
jgi:hypothetical protein